MKTNFIKNSKLRWFGLGAVMGSFNTRNSEEVKLHFKPFKIRN